MKKQEMKVFTMYEGWEAGSKDQSRLVNKTMLAGMEKSSEFHAKREAVIEKKYAVDEIGQRILNGDGGSRIKEPYDPETIFQLDRYHIYQEILRKIRDKKAQKENRELIDTIERYTDGLIFTTQMKEIIRTLSAAKSPKKDGKGNPYVDKTSRHMPLLDAMQTASRKAFRAAFCY